MNNSKEIFTTKPDMLLTYGDNNHLDLFVHEQELTRNMYIIISPL